MCCARPVLSREFKVMLKAERFAGSNAALLDQAESSGDPSKALSRQWLCAAVLILQKPSKLVILAGKDFGQQTHIEELPGHFSTKALNVVMVYPTLTIRRCFLIAAFVVDIRKLLGCDSRASTLWQEHR